MIKHGSDSKARASLVGAIVAAFIASLCCLGPALLGLLGLSGAGLAAVFGPYRPIFLGATIGLLAVGFYLVYRRPKVIVAPAAAEDCPKCDTPRTQRSGKVLLWTTAVFVIVVAAYPYILGKTAKTEMAGTAASVAGAKNVTLRVTGMTCQGCASHVTETLAAIPGVVRATVSYEDQSAVVVYDPSIATVEHLTSALSTLDGYAAKVDGR